MEKLRYKDYTLRCNPSRLVIRSEKRLGTAHAPFAGEVVWDLGYKALTVSGEGEFFGANAMGEYARLNSLYLEGGAGMLYLPDQKPLAAFFAMFEAVGEPGRAGFRYAFRFVEDTQYAGKASAQQRLVHIAQENETLFDIAARYNSEVGALLTLNRDIASPNRLAAGQAVILGAG